MGSSGSLVQAVMPASASEAPISWRKPRRETESTHSEAPLGNSRPSISRNSGVPASSSRLRQNSGPVVCRIWVSTMARSSVWPGQTPWRLDFLASAIWIPNRFHLPPAVSACPDLAVTGVAARYVLDVANLVFRNQRLPERLLVGVLLSIDLDGQLRRGLRVAQVEHLVAGT